MKYDAFEWRFERPIFEDNALENFEKAYRFNLPDLYKSFINTHNGARTDHYEFRSFDKFNSNAKTRALMQFLSFNKLDRSSIWKAADIFERLGHKKHIPFAIDNFGNYICFNKETGGVRFFNHETEEFEYISSNFEDFVENLCMPE